MSNRITNKDLVTIMNRIEALEKNGPREHKFWNTQPVPAFDDRVTDFGPILSDDAMKARRTEPYLLPEGFEWYTVDTTNDNDFEDVANFLNNYYLKDDDGNYITHYPAGMLKWALCPPNYQDDLCLVARVSTNKKIVGFISGILIDMKIGAKTIKMADIDFLCIHPKLRNKNLASILIKEITRRVVAKGHSQAFYAAARMLPKPVSSANFFHRTINLEKLVDTGFTRIEGFELNSAVKYFDYANEYDIDGFRKMEEEHCEQVFKLLNDYLALFTVAIQFDYDTFLHWFHNNPYVSSYVVVDNGIVKDFISFYKVQHKVLKSKNYDFINMAYVFYYVPTKNTLYKLGHNMLIAAKKEGIDVVTAMDIMHNREMIDNLKFSNGSGKLNFYLFNYKCPGLSSANIAKCIL